MEQCESLNEKLFPPSAEGPTNCPFPKKSEEPKRKLHEYGEENYHEDKHE